MSSLKMWSLMRYTCIPNIMCLSLLDQKLCTKLYIWPLTFDIEGWAWPLMLPFKMCGFMRCQMSNICPYWIKGYGQLTLCLTLYFKWWHWPRCYSSKYAVSWKMYVYTKYQMSVWIGSKVLANWTKLYILLPWPCYPSKSAASSDRYACQISSLYLYLLKSYG